VAANLMRRILCDYARSHCRTKRGGGQDALPLDEALIFSEEKSEEMIDVDRALTRLAEMDERKSRIVELRFFGGLTVEETAAVLGISPEAVKRNWRAARAWLYREIHMGKDK
jgi:RNA polymerase sigma factor (TIGR02999 family)